MISERPTAGNARYQTNIQWVLDVERGWMWDVSCLEQDEEVIVEGRPNKCMVRHVARDFSLMGWLIDWLIDQWNKMIFANTLYEISCKADDNVLMVHITWAMILLASPVCHEMMRLTLPMTLRTWRSKPPEPRKKASSERPQLKPTLAFKNEYRIFVNCSFQILLSALCEQADSEKITLAKR